MSAAVKHVETDEEFEQRRAAEHADRIQRIRTIAREELDQGGAGEGGEWDDREALEALVLLARLRPGRPEEVRDALVILGRDAARKLSPEAGEPCYPCFEWTGELLCLLSGYLEGERWAYDYEGYRWYPYQEMIAIHEARYPKAGQGDPMNRYDAPYLPRGVYRAPCLSATGHPVFFAVDHQHRQVQGSEVELTPDREIRPTVRALWELLDQADPRAE